MEERSIGDWAKAVCRGADRFFYAFNALFRIFGSVLQLLRLMTVQLGSCAGDSTLLDAANPPKLVSVGSLRFKGCVLGRGRGILLLCNDS
jgi:hypothetical protein